MNQVQLLSKRHKGQAVFFTLMLVSSAVILALYPRLSFPIATAYVFAPVLKPFYDFYLGLERKQKLIATTILISVLALMIWPLVTLTTMIGAEASDLTQNLPRLEMLLKQRFFELRGYVLETFKVRLDFDPIDLAIRKIKEDGTHWIVDVPKIMGNVIEWLILTPVFTWFFLVENLNLKKNFLRLIPNHWFERSYMLMFQFNRRFGGYIIAKSIEATILGVVLMIGLWSIGFPYAFLLGVVGGVTNIIPYVGPLLGWGSAILVGVMQPYGDLSFAAMTIVYVIANFIDMALVFPLLVSKIVNLHPLIVVVSVILGSEVAGLVGMIVSVPVATFLKLLIEDLHKSLYTESLK